MAEANDYSQAKAALDEEISSAMEQNMKLITVQFLHQKRIEQIENRIPEIKNELEDISNARSDIDEQILK